MAKRFFYVCAGLLGLALTFHLGAHYGHAQGANTLVGAARYIRPSGGGTPYVAVDASGTVYVQDGALWVVADHIPGRPVSISADYAFAGLIVATESGDIYVSSNTMPPSFSFLGNPLAGATSAFRESFGSLKARYRGEPEPQGVKQPTNR